MPLSDADRQFWEAAMRDAVPLARLNHAPSISGNPPKAHPETQPKHTWDLHGMTLSEAYQRTVEQVNNKQFRTLTFITGKSGAMQQEFQHWLDSNPSVRSIECLPGGGAFRVHLKRK